MKPLIPLTGIVNLVLSELSLVDCVKMCFIERSHQKLNVIFRIDFYVIVIANNVNEDNDKENLGNSKS